MGKIVCPSCVYFAEYDERGIATALTEPWAGPAADTPCTLCGGDGPLASIHTQISAAPDALIYASHVCATCAAWWPQRGRHDA
jgi:hypothetical protein